MLRRLIALTAVAAATVPAQAALGTGDIAFTSFNADEDGLSFVTFVDIAAHTTVYFSDNEWSGSTFNSGESYSQWISGDSTVAAGSVVRLSAYDKTTLSASVGTLSAVSVTGNTNRGLSNSNETVYAYLGTDATTPTTFLAAITNGSFDTDGSLAGTGLAEGSTAMRLNSLATSATPDYAAYTGIRAGETSMDAYRTSVANVSNWTVDTTNGAYATTVPDTTAFTVTSAVPEPETYALFLAGLGALGFISRRRQAR